MAVRVFASGQSNSIGWGASGPSFAKVSSSVRVWNNANPLGGNGSAFVTAATAQTGGTFQYTDRNNAFVWFCDKLARTQHEAVDLTFVGRGNSPIELWDADESVSPMLAECIGVWTATGQPPADIFLWHQGENNAGWERTPYEARFDTLLDDLTRGGVIDGNTIVIVGGLAEENNQRVTFNHRVLARLRRATFATSYGLKTSDGTHFDAASLTRLARRYFSAYQFARLRQ
ncbi:sialate O-acetylesterase [Stutzerimonas kunmingensis]|uniref:sialate O-acetylesterase n=1 Tax=Stutzerimonas kunmingensis TaxID=1211807 RepID=UPI002FCA3983